LVVTDPTISLFKIHLSSLQKPHVFELLLYDHGTKDTFVVKGCVQMNMSGNNHQYLIWDG